ncbi:PREDICTED: selenocysteine insertion sequence-binding protein 2, partial [Leptosomus discolor]|uniref:selenocysteine insertion sequence-binding protein 2 n=1 Tax=Leptosomus discolor TaxID=188344 RepID=UPI000522856C
GIKLSAEVKPFVPKHAAVTVAWSEPSEACVFPRYLTTCYPFVQEPSLDKQQVYAEDLPRDDFSSLSQCPSHSVLGDPAFREYSSCCYSPDVVSNVYPVAGLQYHSNNSTHYNGSGIVSESAEQTYPIKQESKNLSKEDTSVEREASSKSLGETVASLIPSSFDSRAFTAPPADGSAQPHVSWAMVLSQPPKKIVSSPATEGLSEGKGKEDNEAKEPPRIEDAEEFPDLAAASDRRNRLGSQKSSFTPAETSRNSGKKSQIPVQLDLGGMLAVLEQKQQTEKSKQSSKPVVFSVGGAIPLLSKEPATTTKSYRLNQGKMPHNPLDSSAPLVKKGKQREVPKAKRPTPLKKIILKEREQRKQQHLLEQTAVPKNEDNICQSAENITEDETLLQGSQAAVPVMQVAEGLLENTGIKESTEGSMTSKQLTSHLPKIHSRNFRDYCSQVLSKEVDSCVTDLLKELVRFQDRLYQKDPVKAKIKRRLVMGLREVLKHLKLKKLKCVIISPNCEKIQSKGGLDETLHNIIDCACEQNIPFVFALNRKALGRCVNKAVPVSVVGIFSYDGAQDHFHRMVQLTTEARKAYKDMIATLEEEAKGGLRETQPSILTTEYEKNGLSETGKTSSKDSDEDVPNYIKIWKRKLEEEYNPYALELEKGATADVVTVNSEEHQ